MFALLQDLKYGTRMLVKSPGFTAVAVLTLALGIGANTAIFSVVDTVLLRPMPYKDPDRLVMIWVTESGSSEGLFPATGPDFQDWRAQNTVFEDIAAGTISGLTLTGAGEPRKLEGVEVSPQMFGMLGVSLSLGRTFAPDESSAGKDHVIILSYGLWQRALGGKRETVGSKITLDGQAYDVAGVMPKNFQFPRIWGVTPEYWVPLNLEQPKWRKERGSHWMWVIARLKPGVTLTQAQAEMETISGRLVAQYPNTNTGVIAKVRTLRDQLTQNVRPALLVLFAAVGFLLLIACANVANLLLAKAAGRQREIAVRLAVGSGRLRLVRQLLTESLLLFLVGGVAGLMVGAAVLRLLLSAAPTGYVPPTMQFHLDYRVFSFTFLVAFVTGLFAGLAPAIQASRPDLVEALKEGGRVASGSHGRSRRLLTAGEVALALVMLIGAGLTIKSLVRLLGVNIGFDARRVLTARVNLPDSRYPKEENVKVFYQNLLDRVRALTGVEGAAAASELPLNGGNNGPVIIEGQASGKNIWTSPLVESCRVTPDFFRTLRIPMLRGRDFTLADSAGAPAVAIINETMARRLWAGQDPIGKRFSHSGDHPKWITVVGVVGDVREFGLSSPAIPEAYYPHYQNPDSGMVLVVRSAGDPLSEVSALRGALQAADKDLPLSDVRALADLVSESSGQERFVALLLGLFAAVALALAAVGIYGVVACSVTQRMHEIGIRMAIGASRTHVLRMVLSEGLRLSLFGVGVGLVGSFWLTKFLEKLLYGVQPRDPATFVLVPIVLPLVALAASLIPARRATKVDPMVALRYE